MTTHFAKRPKVHGPWMWKSIYCLCTGQGFFVESFNHLQRGFRMQSVNSISKGA